MITRRDWQLHNLGITKLVLRRPNVLQGEIPSFFSKNIRLIIVAKKMIELNDIFIKDVLRALNINQNQVFCLTPDEASMLHCENSCNSWQIDVKVDMSLNGSIIVSSSLYELKNNPTERMYFWKQICAHEDNFFCRIMHDTAPK